MTVFIRCIICLLIFFCTTLQAEQTGDSQSFNFSGRLKAATRCSVNNDNPVEVHFGNVGITKIDRGVYVQDIPYSLDCGGTSGVSSVMLTILATPESWDERAMRSSVDGLGAYILKGGQPVALNTLIKIDDPVHPPQLQAKLIKAADAELTAQSFTVTGTMVVEYF